MRVMIAEDSLLVRQGLAGVLAEIGHDVVASSTRADTIPAQVAAYAPDVLVVDIKMPPTNTDDGLRAGIQVRRTHDDVAVLVLSQYVVTGYATMLLEQSPTRSGYLLKDRILDSDVLSDALTRVADGETVVDPSIVSRLMTRRSRAEGPLAHLSEREREVIKLVAEGHSDRGIAEQLHLSLNTVGTHLKHAFTKLGLPDSHLENRRVHAVLVCLSAGGPGAMTRSR